MAALLIERGANLNAANNVQYELLSMFPYSAPTANLYITILSLYFTLQLSKNFYRGVRFNVYDGFLCVYYNMY